MIAEAKAVFTEWGNIIALLFGIAGQLISEEKVTKRFVTNLIWSSILVGIYLMPIILEYAHIDDSSNIAKGLYALSPMVSLQLTSMIAAVLPSIMRDKFLKVFGVTEKELKDSNVTSNSKKS